METTMTVQEFDATFQEEWQNLPIIGVQYDGMEAPQGFSEPMDDLDYTSDQP